MTYENDSNEGGKQDRSPVQAPGPASRRPWYRRKRWWAASAVPLLFYYLWFGGGWFDVATWVFVFTHERLVSPPAEFYDFCAKEAGRRILRTAEGVEGIVISHVISVGDPPPPQWPPAFSLEDTERRTGAVVKWFPWPVRPNLNYLKHYKYIEFYYEPSRASDLSIKALGPAGLYRLKRLLRADNPERCRAFDELYSRNKWGPIDGLVDNKYCIFYKKIISFSSRYEYIDSYFSSIIIRNTIISTSEVLRERSIIRDRKTREILAWATGFAGGDSVGGGEFASPLFCGQGDLPVRKILVPGVPPSNQTEREE